MTPLQIKALNHALKLLEDIDLSGLWADNFKDFESLRMAVEKHRLSLQKDQSQKRRDAIDWIKAALD